MSTVWFSKMNLTTTFFHHQLDVSAHHSTFTVSYAVQHTWIWNRQPHWAKIEMRRWISSEEAVFLVPMMIWSANHSINELQLISHYQYVVLIPNRLLLYSIKEWKWVPNDGNSTHKFAQPPIVVWSNSLWAVKKFGFCYRPARVSTQKPLCEMVHLTLY